MECRCSAQPASPHRRHPVSRAGTRPTKNNSSIGWHRRIDQALTLSVRHPTVREHADTRSRHRSQQSVFLTAALSSAFSQLQLVAPPVQFCYPALPCCNRISRPRRVRAASLRLAAPHKHPHTQSGPIYIAIRWEICPETTPPYITPPRRQGVLPLAAMPLRLCTHAFTSNPSSPALVLLLSPRSSGEGT